MSVIENNIVQILLFGGGAVVAIVAIIAGTMSGVARTREREQTKREIAAYVAEGSITPQDAALLLTGGTDDIQKQIAGGVADGSIDAGDAERLIAALAKSGLGGQKIVAGVVIGKRGRDGEASPA